MNNAQRVIFNTGTLYVKIAVTGVLLLFSSRFVLAALGVVDFGLSSVIAGVMAFMAFLNLAMTTSSQRHLTHALGRGDLVQLNRVFNVCLGLHLALAVLLIILGETLGLWFLNHVLSIPESRQNAAFWIYQFSILATASYVVAVPYQALLTAHEALAAVSVIYIIQSVLTFLLALAIGHAPGDRLIIYVAFSSAIAVLMTLAQVALCRIRYAESRLKTGCMIDRPLTKELLAFSGWSLFGSVAVVGRFQGLAFLLNVFFGPVVNAAYAVANQVSSVVSSFTLSMHQAVSPRLVKQEGAGNRERMLEVSLLTMKYAFFLACFWAIPLFVEMPVILQLWLKHPPEHAVVFCRIVLLMFACDQLSSGFGNLVLAIGNVARFNVVVGIIHLATVPLAYALLKLGFNQDWVLYCSLSTLIVAGAFRGLVVRRLADIPYAKWLNKVVVRGMIGILPAVLFAPLLLLVMPPSAMRICVLFASTGVIAILGAFLAGMSRDEQVQVRALAMQIVRKFCLRTLSVGNVSPRGRSGP